MGRPLQVTHMCCPCCEAQIITSQMIYASQHAQHMRTLQQGCWQQTLHTMHAQLPVLVRACGVWCIVTRLALLHKRRRVTMCHAPHVLTTPSDTHILASRTKHYISTQDADTKNNTPITPHKPEALAVQTQTVKTAGAPSVPAAAAGPDPVMLLLPTHAQPGAGCCWSCCAHACCCSCCCDMLCAAGCVLLIRGALCIGVCWLCVIRRDARHR